MKHFYSSIIEFESLSMELNRLDLSSAEKMHLAQIIDANLHNTILEAILSELSDSDKLIFLGHLGKNDDDKIWELLNSKVENVQDKIKLAAKQLKTEMHKDIKESQKLKNV